MIDEVREGICKSDWTALQEHYLRNALFMVDSSLDLTEVGLKVANDDTEAIQNWLSNGMLSRPQQEQVKAWELDDCRSFQFVIIQPYVLAQVVEH